MHPHEKMRNDKESPPRLIAWELTKRCPLSCRHCRASATDRDYSGELSTEECFRVLDNVASFARPIMILTGGEPMAWTVPRHRPTIVFGRLREPSTGF
jgi:MoaA/NifB/PqqE/SkfB family radical SAM enzyme